MELQPQKLLKEIEEIKARLIFIELRLIGSEKPSKEDIEAVKQALKEYKSGKTISFNFNKTLSLNSTLAIITTLFFQSTT
jgi:hypothetical protein